LGAPKTKTVGGGPTTQLGKDYTSFLDHNVNTYGDAISNLLNGSGTADYNSYIAQLKNQGVGIPNVAGVSSAGANLPNLNGIINTNFSAPQNTFNPMSMFQTYSAPQMNTLPASFTPNAAPVTDFSNPNVAAIQQMSQNALNQGVNDLRERFTQQGGGASNGTGSQYAEAIYRANALPQLTNALSQFSQTESGLGLQNAALNANAGLTQRGQDLGTLSNNLNALLSTQGLNANQAGQFANLLSGQGYQNANLLANTQGLNAGQQNSLASLLMNQGQLGQQNNQFNAQLAQQANLANQSAFGQGIQNQMNLGNMMLGGSQLSQQGILQALQQLASGMGQSTALSTPQAQTVQSPSTFGQVMGGLTSMAGLAGSLMGIPSFANLFGGGGVPQLAPLPGISLTPNYAQP